MIAMDPSAVVAINQGETDGERRAGLISGTTAVMGAPSLPETRMVLLRVSSEGWVDRVLGTIIEEPSFRIADFTRAMEKEALKLPLLFVGADFGHTDIEPAFRS